MELSKVSHIVFYKAYRQPVTEPMQYVMFSDVREAMSFQGSHSRYCSTMELCKVDFNLTEDVLSQILKNQN